MSPAAIVPYVVTITNIGSAAATSVTATLTLPDGSTKGISASNLAPGTSSVSTINFQLAALIPEGTSETEAQYLARLAAADGTLLAASASVIWQDAQGNNYGTVTQQISSTTQRVPILSETPTAPVTILPGSTATLNFNVQNTGSGNAVETDLTVKNPDGTTSRATPFSLNAGSTTMASASWKSAAVKVKQASETDAAYQNRLTGLDNGILAFNASLVWKDASGSKYGPTTASVQSTRVLPVIVPTINGPASANVGDKITYNVMLQEIGHAAAAVEILSVTLPDGTTTTPTLPPGGIASGATVQTTVQYTVPSSQGGILIAAKANVTWADSSGNNYGPLSAVATTQVTSANVPPIVSAGPNQTIELPTNSVTLQGSVTPGRAGSNPISVWTESSGPSTVTFANQSQPVTIATFSISGTYILKLTATDGTLSSSASVTIIVAPLNQPPSVTVGPDQTITYPANTANLTATVTDDGYPIGSHLVISWSVLTGPGTVSFASPSQPNTQAAFSRAGNYILRITASDGQFSAAGDVRVAFNAPAGGGISVSAGGNQVVAMPGAVTLGGSASDSNPPPGSKLAVNWTEVSGPGTATFAAVNSAVTTVNFSDPGVYVLRLTATNGTYTASSDATIYAGQLQCTLGNKSTDFWLMFIGAAVGITDSTPPRQISLFISSDTATSGTASVPGQGLNFPFTVTPGQITTITLPQSVQMTSSDLVESKGIHVTSQNSIAIYGLNFVPAATDGFMALPTTTLGTRYIDLGYGNVFSGPPIFSTSHGTEFGIAATQDNTTVTIVPTANAGARQARHSYSVTLNQGQTYQLRNTTELVDLTGSVITSDKPVAVFGGHDCAFVPENNVYCNHLVEQLPPVNLWGQHFVSYPIAQEKNGDTYRFLAQADNTHVLVNGQQVAQINQGEYFETIIKGPAQIDGDQPILVAEYSNSSSFNQTANIDPTMILVPPFEQFGGSYTINTPTSNFSTNYINVVAATATQGGLVSLDGSPLPGSAFQPIGPSPFSGAQISVGVGAHTLSSALPFGIYAYGFNTYDNYGYAGGACFAKGVNGSTLTASPKTSNAPVTSQVCIQSKVTDAFGNPMGGVGVTFKIAGVNSKTGFVTTDASGTATFCYTGLTPGSDLITITADKASDTANVTWVSNGPNQPPIVKAGPDLSVSLPANTAYLNGSVIDDGLPVGGTLTQTWTEVSGPAPVTFATPTQPQTSVSFPQVGTYFLQLTASDSQLSSTSGVTVIVYPPNQPPAVNAGPDQTFMWMVNILDAIQLNGTATDDGLPTGSTLAINWSLVSGPDLVAIYSPNSAATTVRFNSAGSYVLQLSASDSQYTTKSYVAVHALGPITNNLTPSSSMRAVVGTPVALDPNLLVGGAPPAPGIPLKAIWTLSSWPSGGQQVTFGSPNSPQTTAAFSVTGAYTLGLLITDANYDRGFYQCCLNVNVVQSATPLPVVSLASPTDGTEITSPINVTGSVSDGNWTLEYALKDDLNPMTYVPFASGNGAVTNGTLGTLDPTLLLNGTYSIRLQSTNVTGPAAVATTVDVTRNMKLGVFTLSFNDLTVALPGLPIQIIRTYDSRDKGVGDFGVGWRMSLTNARLQKNHVLGRSWQEAVTFQGQFPVYCLQPTTQKIVTITFPGGKVYRFQASTDQSCTLAAPITAPTMIFTQMPTSANTAGAKLVPQDGGAVLLDGSVPGPVSLDGYDGNVYNPTAFTLTTADGTVYSIEQRLGVTKIRDTNGNTLTITPTGIMHSSGRNLPIERDIQGRVTRITDPDGNAMYYAYGGTGDLANYTDRQANRTGYVYDGSHNLTGIVTPDGQQPITNFYDASGRLTLTKDWIYGTSFTPNLAQQTETITDRNGNPTTYTYDSDGNVIQTKDALGHISSATYDSSDNKLTETNALGKTSTYAYDAFGNRLTEADPLGHTTTYTYNQFQRVLAVTDANQNTTTNTYDGNGNLLTTTDPLGHTTTNTYAINGVLASTKDALNQTSSFGYDQSGNLTSQTDAAGNVTSYTYDGNGNRVTQSATRTLPAGQGGGTQTLTTTFTYDNLNRVVKTTYPDGSNTQVVYNNLGQQSATIDALNHQTTYGYDGSGHQTSISYPDSRYEFIGYDGNGNRSYTVDRLGGAINYSFDGLNRMVQTRINNTGAISSTTYDAIGQVVSSKDANGHVTQYGYDDAGRRTTLTNALNQVTTFGYDAAGNQTSVLDALSHTTTYTYDAANRRTQVTYPDSTFETTAYDALGRVTARTDANGKTTQYGYDVLGRLTSVTDALNQVTSYTYDEVGNRLAQTDANTHTTSYQYDQRGRRIQRKLPLGQFETYTYDGNGNLATKTDFNAKTTTYTYDTMNRLLSKAADPYFVTNHLGAASVTYTYTASGKRATMTDASGTSTYSYGGNDQVASRRSPFGNVGFGYDLAGNLIYGGGGGVTYGYDALNRLSSVNWSTGNGSQTAKYTYDAVGNLASVTYSNGVVHNYSYDAKNRLTNLGVKGTVNGVAGTIAGYAYAVDAAGHRTSVTEQSGRTVNYAYDNLYRLTNETIASDPNAMNGAVNYTYDAVGNRTQKVSTLPGYPGGLLNYNANDQLATDTYDADGNTVGSGANTGANGYVYDFENHLIQQGGTTMLYDGDGNRVQKVAGGVAINYLVDPLSTTGSAQVFTENYYNGTGPRELTHTYFYGLEPLSEVREYAGSPTQYIFYVYDGHGSVRALTDQSGAVTDTYDYDAFGNLIHSTGTTYNNVLFAGEQFDPDLNLYYNRARYLNTSTGRFWSMDAFQGESGAPRSLHKYLYVGANPIGRIDPSGKEETTLAGQAVDLGVYAVLVTIAVISAVAVVCASAALMTSEGVGPCTTRPPQILYHYTAADNLEGIVGSAVLLASPVGTFGSGQYFTDIRPFEAESNTKEDLETALFGAPGRWADSGVGFVGVDVHGLNVNRVANAYGFAFSGKGLFLNETTVQLPLVFRLKSFGLLAFVKDGGH